MKRNELLPCSTTKIKCWSKKSTTKKYIYTVWFHLYKVQHKTQFITGKRGHNGVYLLGKRILTKKGQKNKLLGLENILYLNLGDSSVGVHV